MLIAKKTVINCFKTGDRFRELRKKHGFSVNQLCDLLGIQNAKSIYLWEEGKRLPSIEHMLILCELYGGVTLNDLLVFSKKEEGDETPSFLIIWYYYFSH